MGLFSSLFRSDSSSEGSVHVRRSTQDNAKVTADKYEHKSDGSHTHRSYNQDTSSGEYKEYSGGENSADRT
jgi:hypothetical protein